MGQQCSMCADASSAGLFPPMGAGDAAAQLPTTGYAYLRIDPALGEEIAKWVRKSVDDAELAEPGPPGSDGAESRSSAAEMHVTVATGIEPAALDGIRKLMGDHCPFELRLEQMEVVMDAESGGLAVCIGVATNPALTALRGVLAGVEGVSCGDEGDWTPRVVAVRVRGPGTSAGPELQRALDLRKAVDAAKRIFYQRSWEAAQLVVVMPPAAGTSAEDPQPQVIELPYKGGGI